MKVVCPHCNASYGIDDRRVPASGLNVRCPKCRDTFPVHREVAPAADAPVPLPAPAGAAPAPVPVAPPAPGAPRAAPAAGTAVPLPPPPGAANAPLPPDDGPDPFAFAPPPSAAVPLPAPAERDLLAAGPAPVEPAPHVDPFTSRAGFGLPPEEPLPEPPMAPDEIVVEVQPEREERLPELPTPAEERGLPELAAPEEPAAAAAASEPLGFGEVDFASPPSRPRPDVAPLPDPFAAPPPRAAREPTPGEELEMLFGDGAPPAAAPSPRGPGYKVRRRSGKIFGPFDEAQIVEMLGKGELLGNEDVSGDGGESWSPIGAVAVFGDVLRDVASDSPGPRPPAPELQRGVPFGDRMAGAKVLDAATAARRRLLKIAIPAAAALLAVAAGAGAGFTRHGFFFLNAFRRGDGAVVAALLAEARASLDRGDYPGDRAALDAAARAVAADADSADAAALHAAIVAPLELAHGAPPGALDQARAAAGRLASSDEGKIPALAARLAVTLATSPGEATIPQESALEAALAATPADAELVALLARAALTRGDSPRAGALFARLEALRPGSPRAAHGAALALLAGGDRAGAKAALEAVLKAAPDHLPSRLELAALAEAAGDVAAAEAQLAPLLAEGAEARLAPAERARALALRGVLLARDATKRAEADQALEAAAQADPRSVEARLALGRHRLRHGDAGAAVAALEPLAPRSASLPAVAALRIRALAAAGRALDASVLADQALAARPGDPGLLLAKAAALEASAKADDAAAIYREAAARDPVAFEPRLALGRLALGRGDLAQARVELAAAVEKGPREPLAHAILGELAAAERDAAGAEKAFQAALALDPRYARAELGLAKLALARGDSAGARARLERTLALDPRSAEAHLAHGTLLWKANDLAAAEKAFQAAVDLQPRSALALSRLGAVKLERGEDVEGALSRLGAATNEDPQLAEARQWLGRALLQKNETPGALAQLRKAVELEPQNAEHRLHLGLALERSGGVVEAIEEYRGAVAADPRYVDAHERLALLFAANGRNEEAAAAYEKAVAVAPRASRLRVALADCLARLGRYDDALRGYREVLKTTDPAAAQVPYKVARALHEAEGAKAALPWYERAARDERGNAMPHYYLGYLYKERGQKAKASAAFRRFLELKPDADERKDIEAEIEDLR